MIVVAAGAVGVLSAVGFKTATRGTAEEGSKRGRLKGVVVLIAVAAAEVVLLSRSEVDLDVEAV